VFELVKAASRLPNPLVEPLLYLTFPDSPSLKALFLLAKGQPEALKGQQQQHCSNPYHCMIVQIAAKLPSVRQEFPSRMARPITSRHRTPVMDIRKSEY
jgi:hypothetical protein